MKKSLFLFTALLAIGLVSCTKDMDKNTQTIPVLEAKMSPEDSILLKNAGAIFESPMTQRDIDSLKEMSIMKFPLGSSRKSALYGNEYTDWSGQIHFQVWYNYAYGHTPSVQVAVGPDWVLVGGGAKTGGGKQVKVLI